MDTGFLFSPSRFLLIWARDAWKRRQCGRRFGHFPNGDLYPACTRCRSYLL